ncbi:hypothetical protein SAMN05660964_01711 [Thiothrix caldifontis]|uniref:Uncharacterized protein n=1 Tax=Thiothrix caldifontis TaxID=525918 RepID=A0A1H4BLN4_9GAMM|nr:WG repeat-containing protein [Thiothrix caldifontis]SEA49039.1 hypothetical protein SAMN05660964_01711 [Thiothrix caldifontis]
MKNIPPLLFACSLFLLAQGAIADGLPLTKGHYADGEVLTLTLDEGQKGFIENLRNCHLEGEWETLNEFHLTAEQEQRLKQKAGFSPAAFQLYETYRGDKDVADYSYAYWNSVLRVSEDEIEIPLKLLTSDTQAQADHDKRGWKKPPPCLGRFWRAMDDESAEVVTDCLYSTTDDVGEFGSKGSCGTLDKTGLLHFNQPALDKVDWRNFYGMDCIRVTTNKKASSGWYFLTQEGLGRKTVAADNGCLPFQKGLAVGWVNGKVAYYDRMMKIVHQTDYVWSDDFRTGYAQVCKRKGDRRDYLDCGYIDTNMKVVVETKYPAAETPTPKGNN